MNRRLLEIEVKRLRSEYAYAKKRGDLKAMWEIEAQGKAVSSELANRGKGTCYNCKERDYTELFLPFCSSVCHEEWAAENYKHKPTIHDRIKEFQEKQLVEKKQK